MPRTPVTSSTNMYTTASTVQKESSESAQPSSVTLPVPMACPCSTTVAPSESPANTWRADTYKIATRTRKPPTAVAGTTKRDRWCSRTGAIRRGGSVALEGGRACGRCGPCPGDAHRDGEVSCRSGRSRSRSTTPTLPNGSPPYSGSTPLVWPYLTSADRSRRRPGRGTPPRSGPCTTSFAVLPTHAPGRARSVESRVVGRCHRRCEPLGLLVVVTRGRRPGSADDHRRPRRCRVLLAGREPSLTSLPGSHSRSSDRDCTVSAVDRDQHALVLYHRLRGIRPGGGECIGARRRSVRGLDVGRRSSSGRSVPLLDLHRRWWSRHPLLLPRGVVPAQPSGHGARRAHGRRLD